jgi:hypothetical protein
VRNIKHNTLDSNIRRFVDIHTHRHRHTHTHTHTHAPVCFVVCVVLDGVPAAFHPLEVQLVLCVCVCVRVCVYVRVCARERERESAYSCM